MRDIAGASSDILMYTDGNIKSLGQTLAYAGQYQGTIKDVVGLTKTLGDAEKAIEFSYKARLILGIDLNAQYMQMLAQTQGEDALMKYVVERMGASGRTWKTLTQLQRSTLTSFGINEQMMSGVLGGVTKTTAGTAVGSESDGVNKINSSLNMLGTTANEVDLKMRQVQKTILNFNILGKSIGAWVTQLGPTVMAFGVIVSFAALVVGTIVNVVMGAIGMIGGIISMIFFPIKLLMSLFGIIATMRLASAVSGAGAAGAGAGAGAAGAAGSASM